MDMNRMQPTDEQYQSNGNIANRTAGDGVDDAYNASHIESSQIPESPGSQDSESSTNSHEPLPYNWDAPKEQPERLGFKDLFIQFWHPTIVYCGVFWSFGMCVAFLGPTLLDLGCQTSSDMKRISWVFFFQLYCTLMGSVIAGYLAQRANANYVIMVATSLIPLSMFVIPFCQVLGTLGVVLCIMGLNMGIIDCLANLKMIQLYGDAVSPFLQAMHFCYGLGAFVSPLIAEPFLLNEDCSPFIDDKMVNGTISLSVDVGGLAVNPPPVNIDPLTGTVHINQSDLPAETLEDAQHMTGVRYAFWIMSALQLPIPLLVATLLYKEKNFSWKATPEQEQSAKKVTSNGVHPKSTQKNSSSKPIGGAYGAIAKPKKDEPFWQQEQYRHYNKYKCCGSSTAQVFTITMGTAVALFIFDGVQSAYGGYIYSYAVKSIVDLSNTKGAYLNALYWGMFALGRLISIPVATVCSSALMLSGNIIGCLVSVIVMLTMRHDAVALFTGTAFFGLFLSSSTPTALSLCEQYIDITSSITTFVVVMAALGDMISPVVVGNLFVIMGPVSFLEFILIMCIFAVFAYLVIVITGTQTPKSKAKGPMSFFWCCIRKPDTLDDDDSLVTTHVKYYTRMSESDSNMELSNMADNNKSSTR